MQNRNQSSSFVVDPPILDSYTARQRFNNFKKNKLPAIANFYPDHDTSRKYSFDTFIELLEKIIVTTDVGDYLYTGMRVYFACYKKSNTGVPADDAKNDHDRIPVDESGNFITGQLTLIFVPTISNGSTELQDTNMFYIFNAKGNSLINIGGDGIKWIDKYRESGGIYDILSKDKTNLPSGETKSLWYIIDHIQAAYNSLTNDYSPGEVENITAFFAAYPQSSKNSTKERFKYGRNKILDVDVSSQMTLIFGTGPIPFISESSKTNAFRKLLRKIKARLSLYDVTDYDTGAPCPPAVGCDGGI